MPSTSATVIPFLAYAVPHDRAQARTWARRQINQGLDAFVAITHDPSASVTATTTATFDVVTVAAAFLARAEPAETAECLHAQLYGFDSDFTQDQIGVDTAELFAWVLKPLITEAARTLRMQPLGALQPYLSAGLNRAFTPYLRLDPDLHRVPIRQLCQSLYESISDANPRETVAVLHDLHDLIRPAASVAQVPSALASITLPPTEFPDDFMIEIETGVAMPITDIEASITRLKARRTALDPTSARDEQRAAWITERLDELEDQRRFVEAMNVSICRKHEEEQSKR